MSGNKTIDHEGIVEEVVDKVAKVLINSQSACATCQAKGACNTVDQENKLMLVPTGSISVKPGDRVKVLISKNTGLRAVALGYVFPFLLLITVLFVLTEIGSSELRAGLLSLASLVPYYLTVYLFRNRIGNSFSFTLEKTNFDL